LRGSPVMKLITDQDPSGAASWTDLAKDDFDSSQVSLFSDGFESYQSGDPLGAPWTIAGTPTVNACPGAYEGNNVLLLNPASGNEDAITPPLNFIDPTWKYRVEFWFRVDTKGNGVCDGPDSQDLELSYRKNGGGWNSIRNIDEGDFNRNFWYKEIIDFSNDFPSAIGGMIEVRLRNGYGSPFLGYAWQIDDVEAVKDRFDPTVWDVPNVKNAVLDGDACDVTLPSTVVRFGSNKGNGELRSLNFDLSGKTGHEIFLSFDYRSIDMGGNSNCRKQDKDLLLQVYSGGTWSTITVLSKNTATNPSFLTRNVSVPEQYRTADHQFRLFVNSMQQGRYWWIDNVRLIDYAPSGGTGGAGTVLSVDASAVDPALRDGDLKNGEQYASCGTGNAGCSLATRSKGSHWHYFTAKVGQVSLRSPVSGTHSGPDVGVTGPTISLRLGINLISIGTNNSSFLPTRTLAWLAQNLSSQIIDKSLYIYELRTQEPTGTVRRVISLDNGASYNGDASFLPGYAQSLLVRVKRISGSFASDTATLVGMEFSASEGFTVYDNKTIFFGVANTSYSSALTFLLRLAGPQYCYNEAPSSPCPGGAGLNTAHRWGEPWEIMRWNAMTQSWEAGTYDPGNGDWVWNTASGMPFPITPGEGYILKYRNAGSGVSQFWYVI
ncbi:MAG TPA: hypothetical protein VI893_00280, partial [Thermoplasmata archaeon]|nr:hypothetical protein [Thermoplasmata archaeon]